MFKQKKTHDPDNIHSSMQGQIKNKVIFKPAVDSHDGSQIEKYLSHTKDYVRKQMVLTTQVPYTPNLDADTCGF
jgi:hypothetical protein